MDFTELMEMVSTRQAADTEGFGEGAEQAHFGSSGFDCGSAKEPILAMVIDDCAADRELVSHYIKQSGEAVHLIQCSDLGAAFEQISQQPVDIVLLDYMLPEGVIGPEHIPELRSVARDRHLPVIVLTGYGDEQKVVDAFKEGASDYLAKNDLSPGSIYRAISNAMQKSGLERQVEHNRAIIMHTNGVLRKQNSEIRSFYQTVSHELKSPLAGAKEFTSLVLDGIGGDLTQEQQDWLGYANQCWETLNHLIDDLLDTAAIENGKLSIQPDNNDLAEIARHCLRQYQISAKRKDVKLLLKSAEDVLPVQCDALRIGQLISNLLSNAIKNTPEGGQVELEVGLDASKKSVLIGVSDTGEGIPKDKLLTIFEKFEQLDPGAAGKQPGMGLGLFLCRNIVEMHGGEIIVRSEPGMGSEFRALFPAEQNIETRNEELAQ